MNGADGKRLVAGAAPPRVARGGGGLRAAALLVLVAALVGPAGVGCQAPARVLGPDERNVIDRAKVEYPAGYDLERYVVNLTAPTALDFDAADGSLIVAEGGVGGHDVKVIGFRPDGTRFDVYPLKKRIDIPFIPTGGFRLYAPVGGLMVHDGWIYVSHRDANGFGVITRLRRTGEHETVVAGLPAQGEHGVTDMAIDPTSGRLFFGVGTATNSGVVGLDDDEIGWLDDYPKAHDIPLRETRLLGRRFDTANPFAGLFSQSNETAVSAPFQPFASSNKTVIRGAPDDAPKFNGGIYSIPPTGGDLKPEAHGIRYPRGLAFSEYGRLYFTNNGMELRGSRPVKDDPDAVLRLVPGTWYGWPDFSADLYPVDADALRRIDPTNADRFQPPLGMVIKTGYPDLSFVINHSASGLVAPNRDLLLQGAFPSQSGAAGITFVPAGTSAAAASFKEYAGNAIVALSGDRVPFATGGRTDVGPLGRKVMRIDMDRNQVREFIRNTQGKPASMAGDDPDLLERPIDVAFGPDGSLYVLDFGVMRMNGGKQQVKKAGTGRIYRLSPTRPATAPPADPAQPAGSSEQPAAGAASPLTTQPQ